MTDQTNAGAPMPPAPEPTPVSRGEPPSSVINAVRLMYLQVVLGVIGMIVVVLTRDALKTTIREGNPRLTESQVDTALNAALVFAIIVGLIFTVLYLVLARFVRKGANWARIVTWIIAGLGVLSTVGAFGQPALNVVLAVVGAVVNIVLIVLLALRPSSEYFAARPR